MLKLESFDWVAEEVELPLDSQEPQWLPLQEDEYCSISSPLLISVAPGSPLSRDSTTDFFCNSSRDSNSCVSNSPKPQCFSSETSSSTCTTTLVARPLYKQLPQRHLQLNIRVDQLPKDAVYSSDSVHPLLEDDSALLPRLVSEAPLLPGTSGTIIAMEQFQDLDSVFADVDVEVPAVDVYDDDYIARHEDELNTPDIEKNNPFDSHRLATTSSNPILAAAALAPLFSGNAHHISSHSQHQYHNQQQLILGSNVPTIKQEHDLLSDDTSPKDHNSNYGRLSMQSVQPNLFQVDPEYVNYSNESSPFDESYSTESPFTTSVLNHALDYDATVLRTSELDAILKSEVVIDYRPETNSKLVRESRRNRSSVPRLVLPQYTASFVNVNIDTPDVITAIEAIEADHNTADFNILDCITDQEIATTSDIITNIELPLQTCSNASSPAPLDVVDSPESPKSSPRLRKRESHSDSDEDYVPPSKRSSRRRASITQKRSRKAEQYVESSESDSLSSDDDDDSRSCSSSRKYHTLSTSKSTWNSTSSSQKSRRGRPAGASNKVLVSGDEKYRLMRDKNNEASRKSRLKKKMKECSFYDEQGGLEQRNVQLKAEVAELQRTVQTFRDNLMKLLLSKS